MQPLELVAAKIVQVRGRKVILDSDLAALYGVETRVLLQAVRRNAERYPPDFLFTLSNQEVAILRSQSVISSSTGHGGRRNARLAFTEHGAIMAATVLNSPLAIRMSVYVVRAFVQLRSALAVDGEFARRLNQLEARLVRMTARSWKSCRHCARSRSRRRRRSAAASASCRTS